MENNDKALRLKIAELEAARSQALELLEQLLPITWSEDWDADFVRDKLECAIRFCGGMVEKPNITASRKASATAKRSGSCAPVNGSEASKWRSCSRWPVTLGFLENQLTTDTHDTREQADAVCQMLKRDGLGGEGRIFPEETWIEEVKPQKNS